jgi:cytochrome P450
LISGGATIECDFVSDVAAKVPLDVIAAGVPRADRMQTHALDQRSDRIE